MFEDVLEKLIQKQQEFKAADGRIVEAQKKQKEQYKKQKGIIDYQFKEGDKVLRRNMKQKTQKGSKHEDRCHKILGPPLEWGPHRDFGAPFELALSARWEVAFDTAICPMQSCQNLPSIL